MNMKITDDKNFTEKISIYVPNSQVFLLVSASSTASGGK